jgi:2-C-methyl-D-erythritol 2,4-cyclodiphosphate synthase
MFRIGFGTDVHRLEAGLPLVVGGIRIESEVGAKGHSDGDVLLHAVTDAVLGAAALGDIGTHFKDTDERWRGAESTLFLEHAVSLAREGGYSVVNVDSVVDLERPKLRPYIDEMRSNIARALQVAVECVSIKAKTGEAVDSVGEMRAIRAQAIILLAKV